MVMVNRDIVQRVVMEYMEMPGLALTPRQAARLWNLDPVLCRQILAHLVTNDFLAVSAAGCFLRRTAGRLTPITAAPPGATAAVL